MKAFRTVAAPFALRACAWRVTRPARAGGRWSALRLQWRRNARPQAPLAAGGRRLAPQQTWLTSIHLHFTSLRAHSPMLASRIKPLLAAVTDAPLKPAGVPANTMRRGPAFAAAAPPASARVSNAPSVLAWRAIRAAALSGATLSFRQLVNRAETLLPGAARHVNPMPVSRRASPPNLAWKNASAPQQRRAPIQTAASTSVREKAPALASDAVSWQSATPALVWRKAGVARQAAIGATSLASPPMLFSAPAAQHQAAHAPATPTAAAAIAPVRRQLQAIVPDPALADRLADEVIRRVERSMRIERERRGH